MSLWKILGRAALTGTSAAVTSAAAAARLATTNGSSPYASLNAVTHCLWPDTAYEQREFSSRYTVTGAVIHLGSSVFWAVLFEALRGTRRSRLRDSGAAAATAGIAYVVDYHVVPNRVTPGFEAHVPKKQFGIIYAALGVGLLLATTLKI